MRFINIVLALIVIGLGYWAYHQTIETRAVKREIGAVERQIAAQNARLSVLNAEWAYQNRPDRLRELASINFERLELLPLSPEQFGEVLAIPFPMPLEPAPFDTTALSEERIP